jgi:hypothetical protein
LQLNVETLPQLQGSLTPAKRAAEAFQALGTPSTNHFSAEIQSISRQLTKPAEIHEIIGQLAEKVIRGDHKV